VGSFVGAFVGAFVGNAVRSSLRGAVGAFVGGFVGGFVGAFVGGFVGGFVVGNAVGSSLRDAVGAFVVGGVGLGSPLFCSVRWKRKYSSLPSLRLGVLVIAATPNTASKREVANTAKARFRKCSSAGAFDSATKS
jgi:MFS family permease